MKNVIVTFPSEFKFVTTDFVSCTDSSNLQPNDCTITATNELTIKIITPNVLQYTFQISNLKNPIIEKQPFNFGVRLMNALNTVISSKTINADGLTFIPPSTTSADLKADSPVVFQSSAITLTFRLAYQIPANSILELKMPLAYQRSTLSVHYVQSANIVCTSSSPDFSNSNTCAYLDGNQTIRIIGGFLAGVNPGTTIAIKVSPVYSSPTVTPVVNSLHFRLGSSCTSRIRSSGVFV